MKRGFGSPNYSPERALVVRRAGYQAMVAAGQKHTFAAGAEAREAALKRHTPSQERETLPGTGLDSVRKTPHSSD